MKLRITIKDSDGIGDSINDLILESFPDSLSEAEKDAVADVRLENVREQLKKWIRLDEYMTIEFDLDANTATVIESDDHN